MESKTFSTHEFQKELLLYQIIMLKKVHEKKYKDLSNNINIFIESYLIKLNKNNEDHLTEYNTLLQKFKQLTDRYNKIQEEYISLKIKNEIIIDEFKIYRLNILRFM